MELRDDDNALDNNCPHCGAHTAGDSICPECGLEIFDDSGLEEFDEGEGEANGEEEEE